MKTADVMVDIYIHYGIEHNKKDPKFNVEYVNISKQKIIFAKGYTPNWSKKAFLIKKVKNTVLWIYIFSNLNSEEIVQTFYETKLKKLSQKDMNMN